MVFMTFIATNLTGGVICLRGKYEGLNNQGKPRRTPNTRDAWGWCVHEKYGTAVILVASEK